MKRKVLVLCLAFVAVLIALAFMFRPEPINGSALCSVRVVLQQGAVKFGDAEFSNDQALKARFATYRRENGNCALTIVSGMGEPQDAVQRISRLAFEAGFPAVSVLMEPAGPH